MADTTFANGTVIEPTWLNDVNDNTYGPTAPSGTLRNDLSLTTTATNGAGMVGYDYARSYAVGTIGKKLKQNRSVEDYGTVGDGVTSDQVAVEAAIAAAYAAGDGLYWPDGTYLTTATIPNFHDVRHSGPGVVKRGSDLFYPDPTNTQTNTLYVNKSTGSSTNDGFSSSQPFDEPQNALLAIKKYGPLVGGVWVISCADGTYTTRFDFRFKTKHQIQLKGASWVTSPGFILDGASTETNMISVQDEASLYLENCHVKDCTDNCIEVQNGAVLDARTIHSTGAGKSTTSGSCLYVANLSLATLNGKCTLSDTNSSEGVLTAYGGSIISVGQDGTSSNDSPTIDDGVRLVYAQHNALIKLRRAYLGTTTGGTYGCDAVNSHISHEAGTVDNTTLCYFSRGPGGILMNESSVTHTGHTALRYAAAVEGPQERPIEINSVAWRLTNTYYSGTLTNATITGTTTKTDIVTNALSLLTKDFNFKNRGFKIVVYGSITGTNSTKTLEINGSTAGSLRTIVAVAADVGSFIAEIGVRALSTASTTVDVLKWGSITFDERSPQFVQQVTTDNLSIAQNIAVTGQLGNSADTISVTLVEVYEAGL